MTTHIRFNRYHVTDGTTKARVFYSLDNRADGRPCVTLYARDYDRALGRIFQSEYQNDTEYQTDYFDQGKVVLFEAHPLYADARTRTERIRHERTAA